MLVDPNREALTQARAHNAADAMKAELKRDASIKCPELFVRMMEAAGEEVMGADSITICRTATSNPSVSAALLETSIEFIDSGFNSLPNTLSGIATTIDLKNFKETPVAVAVGAGRLELLARGGSASDLYFAISPETIRQRRYAAALTWDEQDMVDGAESVSVKMLEAIEVGRAARRHVMDMGWALLLANPTLAIDNKPVFHADHSNYGSGGGSVLGDTGLATAMGAIAGQTLPDEDGIACHLSNPARHLRVAPSISHTGRVSVQKLMLDDGQDFTVMSESRLGPAGFVDPSTGDIVTGSNTCWLLAGDASISPSLLIGALDGKLEPKTRTIPLSQGQWGVSIGVVLDVGVAIADYRPLYFSAGV